MDSSHQEISNSEEHETPDNSGQSFQHVATGIDQKNTIVHKRKATRKRTDNPIKDEQSKKKKKFQREQRPNYTVQHGEDMLLLISNVSQFDSVWKHKRKGCKRKKAKTKATSVRKKKEPKEVSKITEEVLGNNGYLEESEAALGFAWSQRMPVEVLVKIFELVVLQDGAIPFLCRAGRVCRLWNIAASSPALWHSVSIGYCWIEPGKSQLPGTEQKIKNTVDWLTQNRFSQLRNFKLCHWKKHVNYVIQTISNACSNLQSLELFYCLGVTKEAFQNLGDACQYLESINVQHTEFQDDGLLSFLETFGSQLRKISFTRSSKIDKLLNALCRGSCPDLRFLEINTKLDSGYCPLPICVQALQLGCPKLQTFRLMNINPVPKMIRNTPSSTFGFPMLEELCIASSSHSFLNDQDLLNILHGSPHLRVLDLRGCSRITAAGLHMLPCERLECLYWGLYFNSKVMVASTKGIPMLTQKWSHSLQELDLTNQPFSEEDMEIAMGHLAHGTGADSFHSLNLSGTKITSGAIRLLVGQSTALSYLNLSSCRYLPRGLKRIYRGQEDVHQLLDKLN
ncbi:F-box/LRR-repeat protein 6 isoform X1 [Silurus meridionalis]|nr:F-box/LRR-repeat protein 6 isoform X1 [Silurus meridionalis]